MLISAISAK